MAAPGGGGTPPAAHLGAGQWAAGPPRGLMQQRAAPWNFGEQAAAAAAAAAAGYPQRLSPQQEAEDAMVVEKMEQALWDSEVGRPFPDPSMQVLGTSVDMMEQCAIHMRGRPAGGAAAGIEAPGTQRVRVSGRTARAGADRGPSFAASPLGGSPAPLFYLDKSSEPPGGSAFWGMSPGGVGMSPMALGDSPGLHLWAPPPPAPADRPRRA